MSNIILAYPNRTDSATFSGGSWTTSLPLSNLKNRLISKFARTTNVNTSSTQFNFTTPDGQASLLRIVVLVNHNLTLSAKWRIRGSNTEGDFTSPVYDSGFMDVWPTVYSQSILEWEYDNFWDGKLSVEERQGFTSNAIHVMPTLKYARYWFVEIDDTTNADGYVQIGRLFISGQWQTDQNFSFGAELGYETETTYEKALGGVEYFDVQPSYRIFRFTLENLSYTDGHQLALDIQRRLGINGELFIIPDPDDLVNMLRRAFLGRLNTLSPIQYPYWDANTAAFETKEII